MFKRILILAILTASLLSFSACSGSSSSNESSSTGSADASSSKSQVETLTIAYLPNDAAPELTTYREGLSKDMQEALKDFGVKKVKEFVASDYNAVVEAMKNGQADLASFGPLTYVQAHDRANAECLVAPALDAKKENCGYYSYIVTQADNKKINSIKDLKGVKFAFVEAGSTSGNLVPSYQIMKAFPDLNLTMDDLHTNGKFFSSVTFSGSHPNGLKAVEKGDIDAAPCASDTYDREIQNKTVDGNKVKIIFKSPIIMGSPIGVRGNLPDDLKKAIKDFYLSYDNDDYFQKFVGEESGQKIRYVEVSNDDYKDISELNQKLNP